MKMLYVEPNKDIREVFRLFFEIECDQACDFVATFKEAIVLLLKSRYELVFFDYRANDDIYKPLLEFIGNIQNPNKPTIIVTTTDASRFNLYDDVSIDYIFVKPFSDESLRKIVDIIQETKNRKLLIAMAQHLHYNTAQETN